MARTTMMGTRLVAAVWAVLLTAPSVVAQESLDQEVPSPAVTTRSEDEKAAEEMPDSVALLTGGSAGGQRKHPFGGFVLLEQQLGSGTFVKDSQARTPYFAWLLSIRPRYYFTNHLFAEMRIDLQQELTTSYGTKTTQKRQLMPSDTFLTVKYQNLVRIPGVDVGLSPFVRIGAPTSYESQYRKLYLSAAAGFDLTRMIGPVFLTYTFRFNKNFNKYTVAIVPKDADRPVIAARSGGAEDLGGYVATGSNNVSFSFYNSLMASLVITDELTFTLQWAVANAFTYYVAPNDIYKAPEAKAGRGQRDVMYGVVDLTYQPWANFGFSLGLSAQQPVKTADNKTIRFPFWDIHTPGENNSVIYFDVFATY